MEKTADLAMIQKTNIDTLHREGKSQRVITERCGCLQSAVSKHIKCKVDQVLPSAVWTIGAGRHVSLHPPPIPLVYNRANLIGVDPSMRIPLCTIL